MKDTCAWCDKEIDGNDNVYECNECGKTICEDCHHELNDDYYCGYCLGVAQDDLDYEQHQAEYERDRADDWKQYGRDRV